METQVPVESLIKAKGTSSVDYRNGIFGKNVAALAEDIKERGIKQPLCVRPVGGMFEVLDGMQRWAAAEILGLKTVPVQFEQLEGQSD